MAHSYTPGLKVLKKTIFKKERILPLKGDVLVKSGDQLTPDTIVASTNLPGNVQMLKVSNILNIDPKDVVEALQVKDGQKVKKGISLLKHLEYLECLNHQSKVQLMALLNLFLKALVELLSEKLLYLLRLMPM